MGIVKNAMEERATENGNITTFVTEQVAAAATATATATATAKWLNLGGTYHVIHWGASSSVDTIAVCTFPLHCLEVKDWRHASIHLTRIKILMRRD